MVWLLSLVCLQDALPAAAAIPCGGEDLEAFQEFQRAVALYDEGWGGSDEALVKAMEQLEELQRASWRESPLMKAYYGSACVARARMVPDRQKPRWLRRGAAELDSAVKAAPADVQVRLLRAVTFAVLPRMAGKAATAKDDFRWLVARADESGRTERPQKRGLSGKPAAGWVSDLSPACRQAIFYHAGSFALRNRDPQAVALLEKAAAIEAGSGIGAERVHRMLRLARQQVRPESQPER